MYSVSFQLNLKDYDALWAHLLEREKGKNWQLVRYALTIFSCLFLIKTLWSVTQGGKGDFFLPVALFSLIAFTCGTFVMPFVYFLRHHMIRQSPEFGHPMQIDLNEQGVNVENETAKGVRFWKHLISIDDAKSYIFIVLNTKQGYVIPKKAFANAEDANQFFSYARHQWEKSQSDSQTPPISTP